MADYVKIDQIDKYQPERRKSNQPHPQERRAINANRCTSDQYNFLRDCLVRRESMQAKVSDRSRILRHILASTAIFFITIYFAAPDFKVVLSGIGINQEITLLQLSAIAPLIIAYLILHACHFGATRLRLIHECKVIELELQRFGCGTSYSLLQEYRTECMATRGLWQDLVSTKSFLAIYSLYDIFLAASVVFAFVGSAFIALQTYGQIVHLSPYAAVGFFTYLSIAIFCSLAAPIALRYSRRKKDAFLEEYIVKRLPSGLTCSS